MEIQGVTTSNTHLSWLTKLQTTMKKDNVRFMLNHIDISSYNMPLHVNNHTSQVSWYTLGTSKALI